MADKIYKIATPIPKGWIKFSIVESTMPGVYGGHRLGRLYGRLNCKTALGWIAKGHYVKQRVFFHSEEDAIACGFRPCHDCVPEKYETWKPQEK
jgi:hypothetical protein